MKSWEILREATEKVGVKALAAKLGLSTALVYKWCQPHDPEDEDASGALNPLDRLAQIVEATGDKELVNWLCNKAGGFFVPDTQVDGRKMGSDLLVGAQQLVKEFSDMLEEVSRSIADDGSIDPGEASRIRRHWETLKRVSESFVLSSEAGLFDKGDGKEE